MAEYLIQDTTLDAIADAINAKTGGSSAMTPAEMVTAIGSISGGGGGDMGGLVMHSGEFTVVSQTTEVPIVHGFNDFPIVIIVSPKALVSNPANNVIGFAAIMTSSNAAKGVSNTPSSIPATTSMIVLRIGLYTNQANPSGKLEVNASSYLKSVTSTEFVFGSSESYPILDTTYIWKAYAFERSGS